MLAANTQLYKLLNGHLVIYLYLVVEKKCSGNIKLWFMGHEFYLHEYAITLRWYWIQLIITLRVVLDTINYMTYSGIYCPFIAITLD